MFSEYCILSNDVAEKDIEKKCLTLFLALSENVKQEDNGTLRKMEAGMQTFYSICGQLADGVKFC